MSGGATLRTVLALAGALGLTLLLEVPAGLVFLRRRDAVLPLILVNVLTNPLLNLLLLISGPAYTAVMIFGEIVAAAAEGLLLDLMLETGRRRAMCCSLLTNALSFTAGLLIRRIG